MTRAAALGRVVVAGTHSGVGKTTVATGLMAALAGRGHRVAGFKVGPDFIDPSYHALATGRPGRNLDAYLSGPELVPRLFAHGAAGADLAVVEGVMGLFDGKPAAAPPGGPAEGGPAEGGPAGDYASTAHVAALLDAPVVLVVDASAMSRSIAAMVHGYATYDPRVRLAGVVANRVGSSGHARLLADALAPLGVELLGALGRDEGLRTPSRHLGLVPAAERRTQARRAVADLAEHVAAAIDLDRLTRLAETAPDLAAEAWHPPQGQATPKPRVSVAGGPAFSFTYPENQELLTAAGAEVVGFDPTADAALPAGTDAVVLGGGFPETHGEALSANVTLRGELAAFARAGGPVVAECGGLLYLCRFLDGHHMCGVIDAEATVGDALTLGYRDVTATGDSSLWPDGARTRGHEFHYSTVSPPAGGRPAWTVTERTGGVREEGFRIGGVHASYVHTHWAATPEAPARLVRRAAARRRAA